MGQGQRPSSRARKVQGVGLVAALLASAMAATANAQDAPALQEREDIIAAIPDDIGPEDIGRLYSSTFAPLQGQGASIRREDAIRVIARLTTERVLQVVSNEHELAVNARVWRIGGGVTLAEARRHGYFRAWEVRRIHELDPTFSVPTVPPGAEWYVSAVYEGALFEAHFSSSDQSRELRLSFDMVQAGASITDFARTRQLQVSFRTVGLENTTQDALFATTEAEMRRSYASGADPRPILVRFSRVPRAARAMVDADAPRSVRVVSVRFPQNPPGGPAWDGLLGGPPDIQVDIRQARQLVKHLTAPIDRHSHQFDALLGDSVVVSPGRPLVFEFLDHDGGAAFERAGQIEIRRFPDSMGQTTLTAATGVELTLDVEPGTPMASASPTPAAPVQEALAAPLTSPPHPVSNPAPSVRPIPIMAPAPALRPGQPRPPVIFIQPGRGVQPR